jgi:hypothetical protein
MFPNNIQFLGRERDRERLREAEHIRLVKLATADRPGWSAGWMIRLLLLAVLVLALMAAPVLVNAAASATGESAVNRRGPSLPCVAPQTTGMLGREGGLLALLGIGGQIDPVASLVNKGTISLRPIHNGQSAAYVGYIQTGCLGHEGGLLSLVNQ